jgi:hypothetical protein
MTSRYFIALVSADLLGEGEKTLAESVAKVLDSKRETLHGRNAMSWLIVVRQRMPAAVLTAGRARLAAAVPF